MPVSATQLRGSQLTQVLLKMAIKTVYVCAFFYGIIVCVILDYCVGVYEKGGGACKDSRRPARKLRRCVQKDGH